MAGSLLRLHSSVCMPQHLRKSSVRERTKKSPHIRGPFSMPGCLLTTATGVLVLANFVADDAAGNRAADDADRISARNDRSGHGTGAGADQGVFLSVGHARAGAEARRDDDDADGSDDCVHDGSFTVF